MYTLYITTLSGSSWYAALFVSRSESLSLSPSLFLSRSQMYTMMYEWEVRMDSIQPSFSFACRVYSMSTHGHFSQLINCNLRNLADLEDSLKFACSFHEIHLPVLQVLANVALSSSAPLRFTVQLVNFHPKCILRDPCVPRKQFLQTIGKQLLHFRNGVKQKTKNH